MKARWFTTAYETWGLSFTASKYQIGIADVNFGAKPGNSSCVNVWLCFILSGSMWKSQCENKNHKAQLFTPETSLSDVLSRVYIEGKLKNKAVSFWPWPRLDTYWPIVLDCSVLFVGLPLDLIIPVVCYEVHMKWPILGETTGGSGRIFWMCIPLDNNRCITAGYPM